jgi:fructose-1,6-bisphosphatase I
MPNPYARVYSVNEGRSRQWSEGPKRFLNDLKSGGLGGGFSLRHVGSLVSDFHRTLLRGGLFMRPPDARDPDGKLRLLYEAAPLALICEQAGGRASNGRTDISEIQPKELHQRTPLYIGSKPLVDAAERYVGGDG